jgi:glutamate 5-kinase
MRGLYNSKLKIQNCQRQQFKTHNSQFIIQPMLTVVKVGSNILTRPDGHVNVSRLSSIVDQLAMLHAAGHKLILVSSGAVACGRGEMHAVHPLDSVEQRQLYSAMGQVKLMNLYYSLFREYGINVGQVLTMKENFISERQYKNQKSCISVMIENNIIPIVNENDTVSITELMFTDNDELSGLMARMMHADNLILLTNVDGVLGSPNPDGKQPTIRTVSSSDEVKQYVNDSKSSFGRGGMTSKCNTALSVAHEGIHVFIANGTRENILQRVLDRDKDTPYTEFV